MRFFPTLFILLIAAGLEPVAAHLLAGFRMQVDLLFACTVCGALLFPLPFLLLVAAAAGILKDCLSTGIFGHSALLFVLFSFAVSRCRGVLLVAHWTTQAGVALVGCIIVWAGYVLLCSIWGLQVNVDIGFMLRAAVCTAAITPAFFKLWRAVV